MKNLASYKQEVVQGFKTTGNIFLGFFTFLCLAAGILPFIGDPGRLGIVGDFVAFAVAL